MLKAIKDLFDESTPELKARLVAIYGLLAYGGRRRAARETRQRAAS